MSFKKSGSVKVVLRLGINFLISALSITPKKKLWKEVITPWQRIAFVAEAQKTKMKGGSKRNYCLSHLQHQ